jgi:kanamycin nucleotidyltransferase
MHHRERMQLAKDICARMFALFPGEVILGGVYGSTARETDTPWSDLEMLFVVRNGCNASSKEFLYRGTAVGYHVFQRKALENLLTHPSLEWPLWMGIFSGLKVLRGDPHQPKAWLAMGLSTPPDRFRKALEKNLPGLVVESYGRILSCRARGNSYDIGCAVIEVLFEMLRALCLLNRRWVTQDYYKGLLEAFNFPKLPKRFQDIVPVLWLAQDPEEIVPLADELVAGFRQLLGDEGIRVIDYQTADELPIG